MQREIDESPGLNIDRRVESWNTLASRFFYDSTRLMTGLRRPIGVIADSRLMLGVGETPCTILSRESLLWMYRSRLSRVDFIDTLYARVPVGISRDTVSEVVVVLEILGIRYKAR